MIGLHLSKIVTQDSVAQININIQRTITEDLSRFETSYLTKTGRIIESEISVKQIQFGDKPAIMHVSRDITERKRTQEVLLKSEELYRNLVENIDIGVNLIDSDHNIVLVNTAQSRMLNKTVSDIIGKKCAE